jgi:type IV pilus assembly protein PilB
MIKKKKKYIGELLIDKGLITYEQLQEVIAEQMKSKQFLGEMFVKKGIISEDDLLETLAEQFALNFVHLKDEVIDWEVARGFSSSLITEHKCLPLRMDEDTVTVAIINPLNAWVLAMVEKEAAPRKVEIVLVKVSDIEKAIEVFRQYSVRTMINKWRKK